jgi:hypothetical protein
MKSQDAGYDLQRIDQRKKREKRVMRVPARL